MIFAGALARLAAAHPERLVVVHWLESVHGLPGASASAAGPCRSATRQRDLRLDRAVRVRNPAAGTPLSPVQFDGGTPGVDPGRRVEGERWGWH